ncbi:hypothetical protein [Streptomyces uncialis]|uniref:Uncharacterized protein n=1 Tax=Streptomyces uncialis TaxID=1048205 RepID=A0A1Q4VAS6_9ACTN|nr:hypothetical protein [Streptomyces uncialis]MCX4658725.1 hypothetical protein [Streptomyces uncialis]OKH94913.1 hypothetical protein AB852_12265 [Streptomyces uncialis]WTE14397.1 hypothetical protein OG924_31730 [Streptomyces uncialis]
MATHEPLAIPGVQVCSLKVETPQLIEPAATYQTLRFPYGAAESSDRFNMHQALQPDGTTVTDWATDDRSGLIRPSRAGWGQLYAMIQWEPASGTNGYTELRDQFVRNPFGVADTTATEHRAPTPGMQCYVKGHGIFVSPDVPLALRVMHNDNAPRRVTLAEFKLVIHEAA